MERNNARAEDLLGERSPGRVSATGQPSGLLNKTVSVLEEFSWNKIQIAELYITLLTDPSALWTQAWKSYSLAKIHSNSDLCCQCDHLSITPSQWKLSISWTPKPICVPGKPQRILHIWVKHERASRQRGSWGSLTPDQTAFIRLDAKGSTRISTHSMCTVSIMLMLSSRFFLIIRVLSWVHRFCFVLYQFHPESFCVHTALL